MDDIVACATSEKIVSRATAAIQRIVATFAINDIVAFATSKKIISIAAAAIQCIVPIFTVNRIIALATGKKIISIAATDEVISCDLPPETSLVLM